MVAYATPTNERSFSGLVDDAIRVTGRASAISQAVGFANAAVRECQLLGLFAQDGVEDLLTANASPYIWTPNPLHRTLATVEYPECDIWPEFKRPGKQQRGEDYLYYGTDDYYVFKGVRQGEPVKVYSYYWLPPLQYFQRSDNTMALPDGPYATRPAFYDTALMRWRYWDATAAVYVDALASPELDEAARRVSSNWLIQKWNHVILEGTKGKLWNAVNDERGKVSYSTYQNYLLDLKRGELYEAEGF